MIIELVIVTSLFTMFPLNMIDINAMNLRNNAKIEEAEIVMDDSNSNYSHKENIKGLLSLYALSDMKIMQNIMKDFEKTKEDLAAEEVFEVAKKAYQEKYRNRNSKKSLRVPYVAQVPEMAMGCEIASSSMMLKKWGINVSKSYIYRKIQSYRSQWTFNETPSIAYSRVKAYNPYGSGFSILFPEQIVPIINEILKEKGRDDLVATAIYNYTMSDMDHIISNYGAPIVIYGGYPITSNGHVALYIGNNIILDPLVEFGTRRHFSRGTLWYAISDGGKDDNRWHVTGQTYGFVILKKTDYEELKEFSKIKLGSQATKTQIVQRKTKITVSSGKKYKLEDLYLVKNEDGSAFVGYRKKVETKPTKYTYIPIEQDGLFNSNQKVISKEKLWEVFPQKLSAKQKEDGLTYDEMYNIIESLAVFQVRQSGNMKKKAAIIKILESASTDTGISETPTVGEYIQWKDYRDNYYKHVHVVIPIEKYEVEIVKQEKKNKK